MGNAQISIRFFDDREVRAVWTVESSQVVSATTQLRLFSPDGKRRFLSNLLLGTNHSMKNREMHVQYIDTEKTQNDTVKSGIDTVNDTVFYLITQNNKITASEISERLKISLSTAKRKLKGLKESGKIERIGSDKTGHWKIIEK